METLRRSDDMKQAQFIATTYKGKPAIMDTAARVFYECRTKARARERAAELNKPQERQQ
jgi:hypothetical protein